MCGFVTVQPDAIECAMIGPEAGKKEELRFGQQLSACGGRRIYTCGFLRNPIFDARDQSRLSAMGKLKLDLHDMYNKGWKIDQALNDIIDEAIENRIPIVEIIPGKGSGQLKKKVIRFLEQKHIKAKYHRIDKDSKNFGRLFVRFKH